MSEARRRREEGSWIHCWHVLGNMGGAAELVLFCANRKLRIGWKGKEQESRGIIYFGVYERAIEYFISEDQSMATQTNCTLKRVYLILYNFGINFARRIPPAR